MLRRTRKSRSKSHQLPELIQFEDIVSPRFDPNDLLDEQESDKKTSVSRFYVPPPYTDEELVTKTPSEWPKSRVVWGLGRLGFTQGRLADPAVSQNLLDRAAILIPSLTTRDMIRVLQAVAYGAIPREFEPLFSIRRSVCVNIDKISELFFMSLVYGHLKLVGRLDWTPTPNCDRMTQFLLSETIHRKNKFDASNFIQLCSLVASNSRVVASHSDSVQMILTQTCDLLKHSRDAKTLMNFGRVVCSVPNDAFFHTVNETLVNKFRNKNWRSADDAVQVGFFFYLSNLMALGTVSDWLKAVSLAKPTKPTNGETSEMLVLVKHVAKMRNQFSLLADEIDQFLESIPVPELTRLTRESVQVYSVLRRMSDACTYNFFAPAKVGPFMLPVCNIAGKIFIEWENGFELESPHRRAVTKLVNETRRWFLKSEGWTVISLDRSDFKKPITNVDSDPPDSLESINLKFMTTISTAFPHLKIDWKQKDVSPNPHRERLSSSNSEPKPRERWESRTKETRLKSHLKLTSKRFRKRKLTNMSRHK